MENQPGIDFGGRWHWIPDTSVPRVAVDGASPIEVDTEPALHPPACVLSGCAGETRGRLLGLRLCEFSDGTLDPASAVRDLADEDLADLADALFVHLDSATPAFGALSWFEFATEELRRRRDTDVESQ